jgi:hypothetical protein
VTGRRHDPEEREPTLDERDAAIAELESGPPFDEPQEDPEDGQRASAASASTARRRGTRGSGGVLAAAMLGLRDVLEGPKKETIVIQSEAPGEPPDVDKLGLKAELEDGRRAVGPPLDDLKERAEATRRASRLRRRRNRS